MQIFECCLARFTNEELDLLAVLARRILLRRNALIFEGVFIHPNNVYAEAATSLEEFKSCTKIEMQPTQTDEVERDTCMTGWQPPPNGVKGELGCTSQ